MSEGPCYLVTITFHISFFRTCCTKYSSYISCHTWLFCNANFHTVFLLFCEVTLINLLYNTNGLCRLSVKAKIRARDNILSLLLYYVYLYDIILTISILKLVVNYISIFYILVCRHLYTIHNFRVLYFVVCALHLVYLNCIYQFYNTIKHKAPPYNF